MEFTHPTYETNQTIAAIATPPGEGGIAVVRITGQKALTVADQMFSGSISSYKTHTAHLGKILDTHGNMIDEGIALLFRAPHSYTGEETVEFHCHGGRLITQKVLETALALGARAALPGEFTFKAFQNGKIDLTRAEAVQQVIASRSELAWQAAENQLEGRLYEKIHAFQKELTDIAAVLEAWVDFPEEDLELITKKELLVELGKTMKNMRHLHESFHEGKGLQTGFSLCLVGAPNVGKSSLMNALTGTKRAIVTDIPGTTRDFLEEEVHFAGLHFQLIDTAGLRDAQGVIEKEGIRRTRQVLREADLVLFVLDVTDPICHESLPEENLPEETTIIVWNKTDLNYKQLPTLPFSHQVHLSAKTGAGLERLKEEVLKVVWKGALPSKEEVVLTNERHFQALGQGIASLERLMEGLKTDLSPEFLTSDLRTALRELGTIIGMNITEEVLSAIFSKFCVGK